MTSATNQTTNSVASESSTSSSAPSIRPDPLLSRAKPKGKAKSKLKKKPTIAQLQATQLKETVQSNLGTSVHDSDIAGLEDDATDDLTDRLLDELDRAEAEEKAVLLGNGSSGKVKEETVSERMQIMGDSFADRLNFGSNVISIAAGGDKRPSRQAARKVTLSLVLPLI